MEKHAVSRMVGSPRLHRYEEGGQLIGCAAQAYCVLLLDEVEKAHPDVSIFSCNCWMRGG